MAHTPGPMLHADGPCTPASRTGCGSSPACCGPCSCSCPAGSCPCSCSAPPAGDPCSGSGSAGPSGLCCGCGSAASGLCCGLSDLAPCCALAPCPSCGPCCARGPRRDPRGRPPCHRPRRRPGEVEGIPQAPSASHRVGRVGRRSPRGRRRKPPSRGLLPPSPLPTHRPTERCMHAYRPNPSPLASVPLAGGRCCQQGTALPLSLTTQRPRRVLNARAHGQLPCTDPPAHCPASPE
jgi:hypothetical protein